MPGWALPLDLMTIAGLPLSPVRTSSSRFATLVLNLGGSPATNVALLGFNLLLLATFGTLVGYSLYSLYRREQQGSESGLALHLQTAEALAFTIEVKNQATTNRLQRLRAFAAEVARHLNLPTDEQEALRTAALLHDIGKMAVPEHILRKFGRLTPQEVEKIKTHPAVGAEILKHLDLPASVVNIVRSHHERWDGSGYPDGLKGARIPIGARILAAVDYLDTLAFNPQNRKTMPLHEAMKCVAERSGNVFDPRVVSALERCRDGFEKLAFAQSESLEGILREGPAYVASGQTASRGNGFLAAVAAARLESQVLF